MYSYQHYSVILKLLILVLKTIQKLTIQRLTIQKLTVIRFSNLFCHGNHSMANIQ